MHNRMHLLSWEMYNSMMKPYERWDVTKTKKILLHKIRDSMTKNVTRLNKNKTK